MKSPSTFTTVVAGTIGAVAAAFVLRSIKRSLSPTIHCNLKCKCGKVKGYIKAKREDSIRIHCYCQDCREYANFVAKQGNHPEETIGENGDNRVVQVCKSDIVITEGMDQLQLSRKGPPVKDVVYMHRYYTKCCHVPMMNTVDFLGFAGVFLDFLDENQKQFDGPVALIPEQALKELPKEKAIFVPDFLWKLARYHSSRKLGPFDYAMEPTYWGTEISSQ